MALSMDEPGLPSDYERKKRILARRAWRGFFKSLPLIGGWIEEVFFAARDEIVQTVGTQAPIAASPAGPPLLPPRNEYFTGRDTELATLCDRLNADRRLAVVGLGGRGKTQLAIEYAHLHAHRYPAGVFWASAESASSLLRDIGTMARRLGLRVPDEAKPEDLGYAWKPWLADHPDWLLVLDQADDVAALEEVWPHVVPPDLSHMPGNVLVTTRDASIVHLGFAEPLDLDDLNEDDATSFLLARTGRPKTEGDAARDLAIELGCLAVALEQAAAYIVHKKIGLAAGLEACRQRRLELLKTRPRTGDYHETVLTTWYLSIETVREENSASADVLTFSSVLAPDWIPHFLLAKGAAHLGEPIATALADAATNPTAVPELLAPLGRLSLVERGDTAFRVHRLVQEVVRAESDRAAWEVRAVRALNAAFPPPEVEHWPEWQAVVGHVQNLHSEAAPAAWEQTDGGRLLHVVAAHYLARGMPDEARRYALHALEVWRTVAPESTYAVVTAKRVLAGALSDLGYREDAENELRWLVQWHRELLGDQHPNTACAMDDLGQCLKDQQRHVEAKSVFEESLASHQLGSKARRVNYACTLSNYAGVLLEIGLLGEAERVQRAAYEILLAEVGEADRNTMTAQMNVGLMLSCQGMFSQAETHYRAVLETAQRNSAQPTTVHVAALDGLARACHAQGKLEEGRQHADHAAALASQVYGDAAPQSWVFADRRTLFPE